jgi:hypothetical protein
MAENKESLIPEPPAPISLVQEAKNAQLEAKENEKVMLDALVLNKFYVYLLLVVLKIIIYFSRIFLGVLDIIKKLEL